MRERLVMEAERHATAVADQPKSVETCFLENLRAHLLVSQWSAENWTQYMDLFEKTLASFTAAAKYTNLTSATEDTRIKRGLERSATFQSIVSKKRSGTWTSDSPTVKTSGLSEKFGGILRVGSDPAKMTAKAGGSADTSTDSQTTSDIPAGEVNLDTEFSFDKLQSLHRQGGEIHKAIEVMSQNRRVLGEMSDHFRKLLASESFSALVDMSNYENEISNFFERVEALRRRFGGFSARLLSLQQVVEENAVLVSTNCHRSEFLFSVHIITFYKYEGAIQYRNMRMSEFLAKQGLASTLQAEEMAIKSRREAASMHIITIWTLIFLPGTFVAVSEEHFY